MVPPSSHRVSRVRRYSGSGLAFPSFAYGILTLSDVPSHALRLNLKVLSAVQNPGNIAIPGLASSAFARHYSRNLA